MDSFELMSEYMQRENAYKPEETIEGEIEARKILQLVNSQKGNSPVIKAKNAGIDYSKYMAAQRLIGRLD